MAAAPSATPAAPEDVDTFTENLELWQLEKLAAAFTVGRKKVKINELAIEADLPRQDVLAWLRQLEKAPEEVQTRVLATRLAAARAAEQRSRVTGRLEHTSAEDAEAQQGETAQEAEERWRIARGDPYVDSVPRRPLRVRNAPWKSNYARKRLSRAAEATLARVFEQAKFPDAAVLDSIWELHRVPRRRAMEWFAARREATREERIAASTALEGDDEDAEELQMQALDRDGRGAQPPHTRAPRSRWEEEGDTIPILQRGGGEGRGRGQRGGSPRGQPGPGQFGSSGADDTASPVFRWEEEGDPAPLAQRGSGDRRPRGTQRGGGPRGSHGRGQSSDQWSQGGSSHPAQVDDRASPGLRWEEEGDPVPLSQRGVERRGRGGARGGGPRGQRGRGRFGEQGSQAVRGPQSWGQALEEPSSAGWWDA